MSEDMRKDDVIIERLDQKFTDFLERYEKDWQHTQTWRNYHDKMIKEHGDFINDFRPIYRRGLLAVGLIVTGSIAIAVKTFWNHVGWK